MRSVIATVLSGLVAALGLGACGSPDDEGPTGSVRVTVATEGAMPDPDGYLLVIGERLPEAIGPADDVMVTGLELGDYEARLEGLASNCYVVGSNPRTIVVEAGIVAIASFVVVCPVAPNGVQVTTSSIGPEPDPDGYLVTIGGGPPHAVPANGTQLVGSGGVGQQPIVVEGVAPNCTASPSNPSTVEVTQGTAANVRLTFVCVATDGALVVRVTGLGDDVQQAGLLVSVDGQQLPITPGTPLNVRVLAGTRSVGLSGLAPNCSIEGSAVQSVVVEVGETVNVTFTIRCTAIPRPTVRVTAATLGVAPDGDGYQVSLTGSYNYYYEPNNFYQVTVPSNGTAEIARVAPDTYYPSVSGVAGNCRVRQVPSPVIVSDTDVAISFTVDCSALRRVAYVANDGPGSDIHFIDTDGTRFPLTVAGADSNPAWARSGTELAIASDRDGNAEIYRMNPDGSGVVRLTDHPLPDYRPAWSPDGTRIAFVSERDGNAEIYLMARDGTGLQRLTTDPGLDTEPAWSPDGTRLAFVSNRGGTALQIYVMNADGSGVQLRSVAVAGDRTPAWSPDGRLIVFSRAIGGSHQLYVMEQSGAGPRLLSGAFTSNAPLNPDWSRDGFEIVFSYGYCDFYYYYGCDSRLVVLDLIGLETRLLETGGELNVSDPAWRP